MSHKFEVRQPVRIKQPGFSAALSSSASVYDVVRLTPAYRTGEGSYRFKSSGFGERAVRESEIAAKASVI